MAEDLIKHYAEIQQPDNSHYSWSDELLSMASAARFVRTGGRTYRSGAAGLMTASRVRGELRESIGLRDASYAIVIRSRLLRWFHLG